MWGQERECLINAAKVNLSMTLVDDSYTVYIRGHTSILGLKLNSKNSQTYSETHTANKVHHLTPRHECHSEQKNLKWDPGSHKISCVNMACAAIPDRGCDMWLGRGLPWVVRLTSVKTEWGIGRHMISIIGCHEWNQSAIKVVCLHDCMMALANLETLVMVLVWCSWGVRNFGI